MIHFSLSLSLCYKDVVHETQFVARASIIFISFFPDHLTINAEEQLAQHIFHLDDELIILQ